MSGYKILDNGIYFAELDGTKGYFEIGRQSGELFADLIKENVSVMRNIYGETIGQQRLDEILEEMLQSKYIDDLKTYMPGLYDEMRGIAEGSGITLKEAFMLNYLEEVPNAVIGEASGKCTAASVINRKDLPNMLFQNMDFTDAYEGFQVVYRINYTDKSVLMYGFVGQFGGIGVNSKGVGVTINVIMNVAANKGKGIPSTAITRGILEQDDIQGCVELFDRLPISTGGSYCVTDPQRAVCFEASANHVEMIKAKGEQYVIHSNHAVQSSDLVDVPGEFKGLEPILDQNGNSSVMTCERYDLAEKLVSENYETLDVEKAKEILATRPILLHCDLGAGLESNTLQSVINICSEKEPGLYVAKGRKEDREYTYLGF